MNKFFLSMLFALATTMSFAQGGLGAQAGDIAVALQLGRGENFGDLNYVNKNSDTYYLSAPTNSTLSTSSNSLVNMIGAEVKYFLASNLAINVSGMGMISASPAQQNVPGVESLSDGTTNDMAIPAYNYVESVASSKYAFNLGADYYLVSGRVAPFVGVQGNFMYGQNKYFTLEDDDLGERFSENYGFGGGLVAGCDYHVAEGMFIGLQVKAVRYMYTVANQTPQPGMEAMAADNHSDRKSVV